MTLKEWTLTSVPARKIQQGVRSGFYAYLTRRVAEDALFFNWSYEEDPPMGLPLDAGDERNRYPIQLYHVTATQNGGLAGKRVLEVGCGRGGGASYLTKANRGLTRLPHGAGTELKRGQAQDRAEDGPQRKPRSR